MKSQEPSSDVQSILDTIAERNPEAILFDDLNNAIVGTGCQWGSSVVAVYDSSKILHELEVVYEFSPVDAAEWFSFNVQCLYAGEHTPIIFDPFPDMDD